MAEMDALGHKKWKFTRAMVEDAPSTRGVYALWENDALICIGRAEGGEDTIRSCLLEHLQGPHGAQSRNATHYSWEICMNPEARERELLREAAGPGDRASVVAHLSTYRRQA